MFRSWFLVLLLAGSALAATAQPQSAAALPPGITVASSVEGITEYRLANGLQVLLVPDDSKPTTTVNVTYRVGSRHENYGETGMAHLLEHLLFKGTPRHPKVWAEFEKRGLSANGTTSFDRTNYFEVVPSNELATALWVESDRMGFLLDTLDAQATSKGAGKRASISVGESTVPQVIDWDAFWAFIRRNNAFELLQKRPAVAAYREHSSKRRDHTVPGVVPYTKRTLSLKAL